MDINYTSHKIKDVIKTRACVYLRHNSTHECYISNIVLGKVFDFSALSFL